MSVIPTIAFQILGPNEGAPEGSVHGLWFKVNRIRYQQTILSWV